MRRLNNRCLGPQFPAEFVLVSRGGGEGIVLVAFFALHALLLLKGGVESVAGSVVWIRMSPREGCLRELSVWSAARGPRDGAVYFKRACSLIHTGGAQ